MPYLVRGKARDKRNRPKPVPIPAPPPAPPTEEKKVEEPIEVLVPEVVVPLEITYRVPKEQRLLDLPLEDEVFVEEEEEDEQEYEVMPVGEPVSITQSGSLNLPSIGSILKKKKKKR